MQSVTVISASAVFFVLQIISVSSLKCYQCANIEPAIPGFDLGFPADKSCVSGGKIDEKLSVTCMDANSINNLLNTTGAAKSQGEFVCLTLESDLKVSGKATKGVIRGCGTFDMQTKQNDCQESTYDELAKADPTGTIEAMLTNFNIDRTSKFSACSCTTDNCNYGSTDSGDKNSALRLLSLSSNIVVVIAIFGMLLY